MNLNLKEILIDEKIQLHVNQIINEFISFTNSLLCNHDVLLKVNLGL